MNFLTLISYLLPNTFGGLSRTVSELAYTGRILENNLSRVIFSNFDRNFLRFPSWEFFSNFHGP